MPILGANPTMLFCKYCQAEVHSEVKFSSPKLPLALLEAVAHFTNCCTGWLAKYRVHSCPTCQLVLAKSI